ncbi:VWA domain-containing protein [Rhodobacter sp. NTK016B]|uniref:vWA domain-containing protein n=1 Tax=Rhodobacter sp. NTK016B TaxID=2759676 RepID=UPI001A8FD872|nr:VWA domain-containing protein [Rhodobacter sp. NTK016B]MBN8290376.1 VWA domain-containing protein [Rhodobacter sp. NTK016B]
MPIFPRRAVSALSLILCLPLPLSAQAQTSPVTPRTMIVMDGSGSMWGQIEGVPKLEIARDVVAEVLAGMDPAATIGLIAYGHRRRGDCSDIEVMVEPAPGSASAISERVNTMRFQGRTPLTEAVRRAAEALRASEDPATVVLVTDGIETCEADPCALARELEQSGVDFTAHVVGFGLSAEEGAQVACLAEETGGRYFQADDAAGLTEALTQTLAPATPEPAAAPEPEVTPAPVLDEQPAPTPRPLPEASLSAPASASALSILNVEVTGPLNPGDYIDIIEEGGDRFNAVPSYTMLSDGLPARIEVPATPGRYTLRYIEQVEGEDARVLAAQPLEVTALTYALDAAETGMGGARFSIGWTGPAAEGDYIDVIEAGETRTHAAPADAYVSEGNPLSLILPLAPGAYEIRYIVEGAEGRVVALTRPLTVTPAQGTLTAPERVGPSSEFTVRFSGPSNNQNWIDLSPVGNQDFSGELSYAYLNPARPEVTLSAPAEPGAYELRFVAEDMRGNRQIIARRPITVVPGVVPPAPAAPAAGK